MNRVILSALLIAVSGLAYSQNKSLGVGTSTPNPNAALHVESPTGNQGAIMPRLSTAQRTAMSGILGAVDAGLLLYDNDLKGLYIWDGAAWQSSAKLQFPLVDTLTTLPPNGNALRIVYNSTDAGNFGVAHFENINPNAGFSALFARTNSATNGAADFVVNNPANNNDAIGVTTNALNGRAGSFSLNNAASFNHALYAQSNGDSTGSAVHGNNLGNGFGVFGKSSGSKFASAAVYGEHVGTGDAAGAFRIINTGNVYSALYGETNGSGAAIFGSQLGLGRGGQFQITNVANAENALRSFTSGTGRAGFFTISNPANDSPAIMGETDGVGAAVYGLNSGPGDTFSPAGHFVVNNPTNNHASVQGNNSGNGPAGRFLVESATNTAPAVDGNTQGDGSAASFTINNASNGSPGVFATTNGTGPAISANQSNGGLAIDITAGGIKNSFVTVSTPGEITERAGVINIDVDGLYTLSTTGRVNGETIHITSSVSGLQVRIELGGGYVVDLNSEYQSATFVFVNGVWKGTGAFAP